MNQKGYTLIEILGAIAIMGIIGTIVTASVSKYIKSSRVKSFIMMSQSVYEATENCIIEDKCATDTEITTTDLIENGYLKELKNPRAKEKKCTGEVTIEDNGENDNTYKNYTYKVTLTCENLGITKDDLNLSSSSVEDDFIGQSITINWPDAKEKN